MKGSTHFRHQRLSAYALVVLLVMLVILGPMNLAFQGFGLVMALYHGLLGCEMVIEDYVRSGRAFLIMLVRAITITLVGVVIWHMGSQALS